MKRARFAFFTCLLLATLTMRVVSQPAPQAGPPGAPPAFGAKEKNETRPTGKNPPPAFPSLLRGGEPVRGAPALPVSGTATNDMGARNYLSQGQAYLTAGKFSEAKEALRTAIRLEPMSLEAWGLYDYIVESHYIGRARDEQINPVIDRDLKPNFSIDQVDSYLEFGNLFLVGELKNVSGSLRRNIEVTGILFDENKREMRRESAPISLKDRGLFPNESNLFEIRFRSPPPGVKSYRVRVSNYE